MPESDVLSKDLVRCGFKFVFLNHLLCFYASRFNGQRKFREWDHQLMQPIYVTKPKKKEQMKDAWDIFEIIEEVPGKDESLEAIMVKKEESGCKLEPL